MLVQIITVDRSKRPARDLAALERQLVEAGHEVVVHRAAAVTAYAGRSGHDETVIQAIWDNDRACFARARRAGAPYTLVLEDDCELDDVAGLEIARRFLDAHTGDVDLFFLGASPNCWWRPTGDRDVVRFSHVYWWHAVIFTRRFIDRLGDAERTWHGPNDLHFSRRIGRGEVRAYGLRRPVAFQIDRRWPGITALYGFPWGDGRQVLAGLAVAAGGWLWLR